MRRTPSTKAIRRGGGAAGGRIAAQAAASTRMSTATASSSSPSWMDPSYSAAQGSSPQRVAPVRHAGAVYPGDRPRRVRSVAGTDERLLRSTQMRRWPGDASAALFFGLALLAGRATAADGLAVDPRDPRFADRPDLVAEAHRHPPRLLPLRERGLRRRDLPSLRRRGRLAARGQPARRRARRAVRGDEPRPRPHRLRRLHEGRRGHRPRPLRRLAPARRPREGLGGRGGALRRRVPPGLPRRAARRGRRAQAGPGHADARRVQVGPRSRAAPGQRPHRQRSPAARRLRGRGPAVRRARPVRPGAPRGVLRGEAGRRAHDGGRQRARREVPDHLRGRRPPPPRTTSWWRRSRSATSPATPACAPTWAPRASSTARG